MQFPLYPRPPDEVPRAFYENMTKDKEGGGTSNGAFAELNIGEERLRASTTPPGPPPSFAPPIPPCRNK